MDELKAYIESVTGVPAALMNGTTPEEIITSARALLAFKQTAPESENAPGKTPAELFAGWLNALEGNAPAETEADKARAELDKLAEMVRTARGGYPYTADPGEANAPADQDAGKTPAELFAEWAQTKTEFNPAKLEPGTEALKALIAGALKANN